MTHEEKKNAIITHERQRAAIIARKVLDRPELALWMILLPIFFIFYFWQLRRYAQGLQSFMANFLLTPTRCLQEASYAVASHTEPDIEAIVRKANDLEQKHHTPYRKWVELLTMHYQHLLQTEGTSYEALIKNHYRTKSNFLLVLTRIDRVEREFHTVLFQDAEKDSTELQCLKHMEEQVTKERKEQAQRIFAQS